MRISHKMLAEFKEAVEEGQFEGRHSRPIALGLDFLGRMIETSRMQIQMAKREEQDMIKRGKDAILQAGGKVHGDPSIIQPAPTVA